MRAQDWLAVGCSVIIVVGLGLAIGIGWALVAGGALGLLTAVGWHMQDRKPDEPAT